MAKKKRKPKPHKPKNKKKKSASRASGRDTTRSIKEKDTGAVTSIRSASQFEREILESEKPAIVDFWAEWCGPCKAMAPIFEAAAEEYGETITFAKLDTEAVPSVAESMGVRSLPTLLVFWEGKVIDVKVGLTPAHGMERLVKRLHKRMNKAQEGEGGNSGGFFAKLKGFFGG